MAKSRARTKTRVSKRSGRKDRNYSFYYGLLLGIFGTSAVWFGTDFMNLNRTSTVEPAKSNESVSRTYEFWDTLPDADIEANVGPYQDGTADADGAVGTERSSNVEYLVQVASFKDQVEAETLRAELLLEGLEAETSEVILSGQDRWYRVVIGPFKTRRTTQTAINRLNNRPISPLILKRPIQEDQNPQG